VKIIVGLGNPGRKYDGTRHNVGWWALDHLADVWHLDPWRSEGDALVADGEMGGERVRALKPQTYMNLSGVALRPYLRRLEFSGLHNLLVLVDEVAIPIGTLRLRAAGSAGGHNGLKSIESTLGTRDYARLRIGIAPAAVSRPDGAGSDGGGSEGSQPLASELEARRPEGDLADFVLDQFTAEERTIITSLLPRVREAVECWGREGVAKAMNVCNRPPKAE
jgi:peptidyl-tRNA hydrolase, PTH1 family